MKRIVTNLVSILLSACVAFAVIGCASTSTKESTGEYIDDSTITAKVKARFVKDPDVKASQVNVETFKGVVQLSGFVDRPEQADRAVEIARGVQGVKEVKNSIVVKRGS